MTTQPQLPGMPPDTVYVNFHDVIDDVRVRALMEICTNIVQQAKPQRLYFGLSSPGGSVAAGVALYSFLRSLPVKLTMHNIGSVDSIATAIFMAADAEERRACAHSSFLFHGVGMSFGQGANMNTMQLREVLSSLTQDENKIAQIITARSAITIPEIQDLFRQGEAKPPAYALEKGIIHEVGDFVIPNGAPIVTVNVKQPH